MNLLWLDLETTGLDPHKDRILECAFALARLDAPFDLGPMHQAVFHLAPPEWHGLHPVVREMHAKNGLLEECAATGTLLSAMEDVLVPLLDALTPEYDEQGKRLLPVLAGSSIHFDHAFIRVHMPLLSERLSHRHYDVSAVKLFCQSLGMPRFPKAEAHRAEADIRESVAHAKACREWLCENARRIERGKHGR